MAFLDNVKKFFNKTPTPPSVKQLDAHVNGVQKKFLGDLGKVFQMIKPQSGGMRQRNSQPYNTYPYHLDTLYGVAQNSDTITTIHMALRREAFRNGYEVLEAEKTNEDVTTEQVADKVLNPKSKEQSDQVQKAIIEKFNNINENGQTVIEVFKELEDDFNTADDAFMLILFNYWLDNGEINFEKSQFAEAIRADPRHMDLVINKLDRPGFDDDGQELLTCPEHRDSIYPDRETCPVCGGKTYRAHYKSIRGDNEVYYFRWEVVHKMRYRPSKRRGFSPIITTWQKIRTLQAQEEYILELYEGKRPPKGMLVFNTSNQESLQVAWQDMIARVQEDPFLPAIMGIESKGGEGAKVAEFFDFMKSLDELQFTSAREEYRRTIGAVWGVLPIWQADTSQSGGLNNEGMQVTVTNRTVESNQEDYNDFFFPALLKAMHAEGWVSRLRPSEEQDEMAKLQRQEVSLRNGKAALDVGLEAEFDEDTGEVKVKSGSLEKPETPFGLFGGEDDDEESQEDSGRPAKPKPVEAPKPPESGVSKVAPIGEIEKIIMGEIQKFIKKFKTFPTEKELKKAIEGISQKMQSSMKAKTESAFAKVYKIGVDKVERELNRNFPIEKLDFEAIKVLSESPTLSRAYKGIADSITININKIISQAYHDPAGLSLQAMTKSIKELSGIAESKAEHIARTETGNVSAAARRNSYKKADPEDKFLFKHIGPDDNRTTQTSKRIKERTRKGVSWDDYVMIVTEEAAKDFPEWSVNKDAPQSHYQTRHTFSRVV